MKKEIFVVNIDNYLPDICSITIPTIEQYAKKISAKFTLITERKYPDFPPTYEKLQIYDLGKDNDYNILIDADMVIKPTMYDVTRLVPAGQIGIWMIYDPSITIARDEYLFNGRRQAIALNFFVTTRTTHHVWKPLEFSIAEIKNRMKRLFVVDEYAISRNVAETNIQATSIILPKAEEHFMHCNVTTDMKHPSKVVKSIREFLNPDILKMEDFSFIQIGAFTGNSIIDTILKDRPKAKGILIEPVPWFYEKLKKHYQKYGDRVKFENTVISNVAEELDFYAMPDQENLPIECQLSSLHQDIIEAHKTGIKPIKMRYKTITPSNLILKYEIKTLNLLMMDTEGHDLIILKSFPFNIIKPEKIIFEYKHIDGAFCYEEGLIEAKSFLTTLGYACVISDLENMTAFLR